MPISSINSTFARKEQTLQIFFSITSLYMLVYAVFDYFIYSAATGYVLAVYVLALLLLKLLSQKRVINHAVTIKALAGVTLFYVIPCIIYFSGGLFSPVVACYIIVPMGALLLTGKSTVAYLLTGICILYFAVLTVLKINHFHFPPFNKNYAAIGALLDYTGLTILVFVLTSMYEKQKSLAAKTLEAEQQLFINHTQQLPGVTFQLKLNNERDLSFNFLSETATAILGVDADDVKKDAQLFFNLISSEDFTKITAQLYHSRQNMTNWDYEYKIILADKTVKWLKGTAKPEKQPDGSAVWHGYFSDITGDKQAQEIISQTQENFEQIITTINDVSYLYDIENNKYLFISPNCKKILGVDAHFFYEGKNYNKLIVHEDDRKKMQEANERVNAGYLYDVDFRSIVDGEVRWLNEKSYPIKNEKGDIVKNSGVITDITYRKLTEEKLLDSQANISQISSTINDTFFLYDCVKLKYLYMSPNCIKTLGVNDAFFYEGKNYTECYVHPQDRQKLSDAYKDIANDNGYEIDYRTTINKETKWIKEKSYAIKDENGKTIKITGVVTDITDKKIAEDRQEKAQRALEEAQELANIGVWEYSFFTNTSVWSKEMFKIFNIDDTTEDLLELFKTKVHKDDLSIVDNAIKTILKGKSVHSTELRIYDDKSEIKYVSLVANVIKHISIKKIIGLRAVFQDVTKQKLAAMAKSNFLSTMSHEIRTPINGVIGIANLLLDEELTHTQKEYVNTLIFSAQHLSTVVSDILDFSKIESGSFTFEKVPFDVEQVCSNIFKLFEGKATEKHIGYIFRPVKFSNYSLHGDYVRLSQVLTNLISNAVKFTQKGGVQFSYGVKEENSKQVTILFTIKDTGIGIPSNHQKRIFESFLQADDTVTRKYGGTGLGLTISKKLVELQGGKIWLESIHGKGSEFYVEMTFDKHFFQEHKTIDKTENKKDKQHIKGMKVLIAEDNKINAMVITRFLNNWQIENSLASDGKEAISLLEKENFDAVLMDLQMPVMDGRQATKIIRQSDDETIKKIPIIALTADALVESQKALLINGFNDCITKPFSPEVLFNTLKKHYQVQLAPL